MMLKVALKLELHNKGTVKWFQILLFFINFLLHFFRRLLQLHQYMEIHHFLRNTPEATINMLLLLIYSNVCSQCYVTFTYNFQFCHIYSTADTDISVAALLWIYYFFVSMKLNSLWSILLLAVVSRERPKTEALYLARIAASI